MAGIVCLQTRAGGRLTEPTQTDPELTELLLCPYLGGNIEVLNG